MDGRVIELLRDLATTFDLERSPLAEISDLGQQAVPCLIKALTHADPVIRKMAAFALGELRSPFGDSPDLSPAVPHLEQLLDTDADPHVRMQAAESLWYLTESKKAIHTFVNGLSESDLGIRRWAAAMLGLSGMQVEEAIQPLIHALDDDDLLLRRCVGRVSARFGADAAEALPKLEPLLDEDEFTRLIGANAILSIAPSRTEELGPMLIERSAESSVEHPPRCGGVPGWSSSSGEDRLGGTDRGPGRRARGRASNGATSDHESGIGCSARRSGNPHNPAW